MISTPIAYIVFNRPEHTKKSFAVLREHQPSQLFIIADGPRSTHPEDIERCAEVRAVIKQVDWPCKVYYNYSNYNLGLKNRVSSGLNWVFDHVERAIVLEDDCVANKDFFSFCDTLLELYAENENISVITGNNFQNDQWRGDASYYFSKYNHCWGWATWRRAWRYYQGRIPFWPEWRNSDTWLKQTPDKVERHFWELIFERVHKEQIDSWAYPWVASTWYHGGLTVTPNMNLVSNIGFDEVSTHTSKKNSKFSKMPTRKLGVLKHPKIIHRNLEADLWTFDYHFGGKNLRFPYNFIIFPSRLLSYIIRNLTKIYNKFL